MGHVDEEMTLRYTHVIEDAAKDVAAEFDKMLLPEVASLEEKLSFQVSADLILFL